MEITCVTVDCRDPQAVAAFWNEALGRGGVTTAPDGSRAVCRPIGGGPYLEFVRVPDDKVVKNRVHLGCTAGSLDDLDAELDRLRALGATIAWEDCGDVTDGSRRDRTTDRTPTRTDTFPWERVIGSRWDGRGRDAPTGTRLSRSVVDARRRLTPDGRRNRLGA